MLTNLLNYANLLAFTILALIPLIGFKRLDWFQFLQWIACGCGLIYLFFSCQRKMRAAAAEAREVDLQRAVIHRPAYRVIIYLYLQYLFLRFYPTEYSLYNGLFVGAVVCALVISVVLYIRTGNSEPERPKPPLLKIDAYILGIAVGLWVISLLGGDGLSAGLLSKIGLLVAFLIPYVLTVLNLNQLVPSTAKTRSIYPYTFIFFSSLAILYGFADMTRIQYEIRKARATVQSGRFVESCNLYLGLEADNWPQFSLAEPTLYLSVADTLAARRIESGKTLQLLRLYLKRTNNALPLRFFSTYTAVGDSLVLAGDFAEAQSTYNELAFRIGDPLAVLTYIKDLKETPAGQRMWNGKPYVTIRSFELGENDLLKHWTIKDGLSHKKKEHRIAPSGYEGTHSGYLNVEYQRTDSAPDDTGGEYDYWSFFTKIDIPGYPLGVRFYAHNARDQRSDVRLIVNLRWPQTSGVDRSPAVELSAARWQEVSISEIRYDEAWGKPFIDQIGIDTFGKDSEFFIDEFQLFTF